MQQRQRRHGIHPSILHPFNLVASLKSGQRPTIDEPTTTLNTCNLPPFLVVVITQHIAAPKMSSFGTKRKARIIQTLDDDDADLGPSLIGGEEAKKDGECALPQAAQQQHLEPSVLISTKTRKSKQADTLPAAPPQGHIKFGRSKPAKSSSLRKSINFNDDDDDTTTTQPNNGDTAPITSASATADDLSSPVVIRPSLSRSGSTKQKKRQSSSRLSFGPSEIGADADAAEPPTTSLSTPKKTLGKRALENNALRRSSSLQNLASRFAGGDEERPRYSKEYLEELQSSTPNTPQNLSSLRITDDADHDDNDNDDVMDLDAAELDGVLVVPPPPDSLSLAPAAAHVLTDAEIRERKERRARLAKEAEFISLSGSDSDSSPRGSSSRVTVAFSKPAKRSESRLIAEDEDLGEGYDEFVHDGGLALGRQASSAAAQRQRQQIAELIYAAEANSDAESDDSEAERRAAYEAAQRRAGMDGLHRLGDDDDDDRDEIGLSAVPRMKPLPELGDVLQRMRGLVQGLEDDVARKRARIADLQREKDEILQREREVQEILNQAGAKYQEVMGGAAAAVTAGGVGDAIKMAAAVAAQSPLRPLPPGIAVGEHLSVERGLESFGTTPTTRPDLEDMV
ncbi:nineteen complex-related protein 2-domain-containing protein [Podospora appendiculata]|uniref:Nineteen complex-related protein 2-domain-containing protein n=1 Tax=Podospora appendiculata TaxID=314037 RepID=A0AAE0XHL8_9PEZI|nr:nineteen complex-related protein 2-domain-containing protein [Podospora appendiculata]